MSIQNGQEVALCFDFDQFGLSTMTCGPASVALCASMGEVGSSLTHDAAWAVQTMVNLYSKYIGPDTAQDFNGITDDNQLYSMIRDMDAHYQNLYPDGPIDGKNTAYGQAQGLLKAAIRQWVAKGYPVIVGVAESSVVDVDSGKSPYTWNTSGYYHILTVTGNAANGVDFLVRDTANVAESIDNKPRVYASTPLQITSATVYGVSWLPRPLIPNPSVPAPVAPVEAAQWTQEMMDMWNATSLKLDTTTSIAASWARAYLNYGKHFGPPVTKELTTVYPDGTTPLLRQCFLYAECEHDSEKQTNQWFNSSGWIGSF